MRMVDRVCTIISWPDDDGDGATSRTWDLTGVDLDRLLQVLGEPVMERVLTAEEMQAYGAVPGPFLLRD